MRNKWIIWYAVALHATWGGLLLSSASVMNITAVHHLSLVIPNRWLLAVAMIVIALSAGLALAFRPMLRSLVLVLPQQMFLMISAVGAVVAISKSQFADGVLRPWQFIATDQVPAILAAVLHTLALVEWLGKRR